MSVRFRARARDDLNSIADFIAADNPSAARSMVAHIRRACGTIGDNPGIGRARPELGEGLRSFPVRGYVIFCRESGDDVDVVAIVHGAREIGGLL